MDTSAVTVASGYSKSTSRAVTAPLAAWVSVRDLAAHLGVSRRTIYRLIDAGTLRPIRVGSRYEK